MATAGQRVAAPHGSHPGQAAKSPQATRLPGASGSAPHASPSLSTATSTPRRTGSPASAATERDVSPGRMRAVAGSTAGARSSRQAATAMAGSGGGRLPAASRTSSSRGESGPVGSDPARTSERTSGEIARGVPATDFTEREPDTGLGESQADLLQVDRDGSGRRRDPARHRGVRSGIDAGPEGGRERALPPGGVEHGPSAHRADPGAHHDRVGGHRVEGGDRRPGRERPAVGQRDPAADHRAPGPIPVADAAAVATDFASTSVASARNRPSSTPDPSTGSLNRTATCGEIGAIPSPSGTTETTRGAGSGASGPQASSAASATATGRLAFLIGGPPAGEESPGELVELGSDLVDLVLPLGALGRLARRIERQLDEQASALEEEPGGAPDALLPPIDETGGGPGCGGLVAGEDELVQVPAGPDAELGGRVQPQVVGLDRSGDADHPRVALGAAGVERDPRQPVGAARTRHPGPEPVGVDPVVRRRGPLDVRDGRVAGRDQREDAADLAPGGGSGVARHGCGQG